MRITIVFLLLVHTPLFVFANNYKDVIQCTTWNTPMKMSQNGLLTPDTLDGKVKSEIHTCQFYDDIEFGKSANCNLHHSDLKVHLVTKGSDHPKHFEINISTPTINLSKVGGDHLSFFDKVFNKSFSLLCTVVDKI